MKCPRHNDTLKRSLKWSACPKCHGLWIKGKQVRKFLGRSHHKNITILQKHAGKPTDLVCPKDGAPLREITMKGVSVDCCSKCEGVWFDLGELNQLEREIKNPTARNRPAPTNPIETAAEVTLTSFDLAGEFLIGMLE